MAERRMVSKRIVNSARFLKMPISSQALYFHLCINADDDGIVEAYNIIRGVGATEDDLRVLVAKEYVKVLNDDLVTYIIDWRENNKLRADRKIDSIYKPLLLSVMPDADLLQRKNRADLKKKEEVDVHWTSNGQQMDCVGKDSIGKDSIDNNILSDKSDELLCSFEELYKKYLTVHKSYNGKGKAKTKYIKWCTTGCKVNGKTVKLTPQQIENGIFNYVQDHYDKEAKNEWVPEFKNIDTLMNQILDWIGEEV